MRYYNLSGKPIDRRMHYIIVMDTETCNTQDIDGKLDMSSVFIYDMGWQVTDKRGTVYEEKSYIVKDIFEHETELMQSAYYADKIPQYLEDIASGKRKVATYYEIRQDFLDTMKRYETMTVAAHNMRFDSNATNTTQRWLTKSKYRYYFPKEIVICDTLKMARDVILKMPTYRKFCEEHELLTKNGRLSASAENLYRFIIKDPTFVESHTGLEDVMIEKEIDNEINEFEYRLRSQGLQMEMYLQYLSTAILYFREN